MTLHKPSPSPSTEVPLKERATVADVEEALKIVGNPFVALADDLAKSRGGDSLAHILEEMQKKGQELATIIDSDLTTFSVQRMRNTQSNDPDSYLAVVTYTNKIIFSNPVSFVVTYDSGPKAAVNTRVRSLSLTPGDAYYHRVSLDLLKGAEYHFYPEGQENGPEKVITNPPVEPPVVRPLMTKKDIAFFVAVAKELSTNLRVALLPSATPS